MWNWKDEKIFLKNDKDICICSKTYRIHVAKHFFHGPVLVPVLTRWCQLELQKPDPEPPVFAVQTGYTHITGIYTYLVVMDAAPG